MDNLKFYIEYHLWAHKKVLQQLATLPAEDWSKPQGGSFGSLKALYQHLLESDYRWLRRWQGVPFAAIPAEFVVEGYESLQNFWVPQLDEMLVTANAFLAADAQQPV